MYDARTIDQSECGIACILEILTEFGRALSGPSKGIKRGHIGKKL